MEKIPTLFVRDPADMARVLPEIHPDCQWVVEGEGDATRKYDGTCVMLDRDGQWWARREVKPGKNPPPGYRAISTDDNTGKTVGWEPIGQSSFHKMHVEALGAGRFARSFLPGTYELIGPKIQGDPEKRDRHEMVPHGLETLATFDGHEPGDLTYDGLRTLVLWLRDEHGWEGIVWHHPDGRMAKLKARDFAA